MRLKHKSVILHKDGDGDYWSEVSDTYRKGVFACSKWVLALGHFKSKPDSIEIFVSNIDKPGYRKVKGFVDEFENDSTLIFNSVKIRVARTIIRHFLGTGIAGKEISTYFKISKVK